MLTSTNSALSSLCDCFQNVDFDGIQDIVDRLIDPMIAAAVKADPQNFMIGEMQKNNIPVPDGLHFHWRDGNSLVLPEAAYYLPPPASIVFVATPNKPFKLEAFRVGGTGGDLTVGSITNPNPYKNCHIYIII
jgi:hypothetical protein